MTEESIARVQACFTALTRGTAEPHALPAQFYKELFEAAPQRRALFPQDLTALKAHFDAALALVVRNMREMDALQPSLRDLGAQHLRFGAQPQHYPVAREALLRAIRHLSAASWNETLERDWRSAITAIMVPMLQGAAVATAVAAERLVEET